MFPAEAHEEFHLRVPGVPMTLRKSLFASAAMVAATFPHTSALAQDFTLEEIVVTAQRRETSLQETPVAVTALSALQIERQQVTETIDLIRSIPNMQGNNNVTIGLSNSYFLRGIGNTESIATFDVPVGTYVDDIYIARQNGNNIELVDIERIEVLRGPQGTLFGRNTTGGAISIITRKPAEEFGAKGEVSYGRFNEMRVKGSVNVPLTDKLLTNFSGYYMNDDGWMTSLTTGEEYNFQDAWGIRGAVRLLASDNVTWDVSADYSETDHQNLGAAVDGAASATNRSASNSGPWQGASGRENFTDLVPCKNGDTALEWLANGCTANEVYGYNISSNLAIDASDNLSINVITGYRNLDHNFVSPLLDNNPQLTFGLEAFYLANNGSHNQFSQEVKFNVDAMDGRLNVVTGFFYMNETNFTEFSDLIRLPGLPFNILTADRDMENNTESFAWYGQADFEIVDNLTLSAGLRWTDEQKTMDIDFFNAAGTIVETEQDIPAPDKFTTVRWTPRFALRYNVSDDVMVYASATNGFKSGGWAARSTPAINFRSFNEETVWSYEMGLRAEFLDNRLRTNVTIYDANYDDIQIATVLPGTATFVTENGGDTNNRGLELELSALVTEGLTVFLNAGYMDAEFKSLSDRALASGFTTGTIPVRSPDYTGQLGFSYVTALDSMDGDINVNADIQVTDNFHVNNQNAPSGFNLGYETVNASIGYDSEDGSWGVSLGCKNCLNEKYWTTDFLSTRFLGDPMRWALRLKFAYN